MAVLGTSGITNVVLSLMQAEPIVSQINREVVALNLLDTLPCGDPLSWDVKFRNRTAAGAVAETDAAPTATSHFRIKATLNVGEYSDTAGVTGRAQAAAAMALNPLGIANGPDLMADELRDAVVNVAETLGGAIYSGSGSNAIIGMATAIDSTGTYANIDPSTYTEWVSTEDTGTLANLSFAMLRTTITNIRNACGKRPNLALCKPDVLDRIKSLFSVYPAYVGEVTLNGVVRKLTSGARAVYVEDVWFVDDPRCTSNVIYFLNTEYIKIRSMPQFTSQSFSPEQIASEIKRLTGETVRADEASMLVGRALNGGIIPFIKRLGPTGNQENDQVIVYPQLQVIRRNAHGKLVLS